ncbi:MAG: penicillin-binding protein 2 [Gammaproteobacteria bacterium]|nr:penicillin-binding protein 2 [Gammaproteobacteria bacterium]
MKDYLPQATGRWRYLTVWLVFVVVSTVLVARAFELHVLNKKFLQTQGDARSLRTLPLTAHRGMITDRHGEPLAVSTPVDSVWANPAQFDPNKKQLQELAKLLETTPRAIQELIAARADKEFVYLKRHDTPETAQRVSALQIPGVSLLREYRRYYPDGEVFAHVIGMTNVDDNGQEGIELSYDSWLRGTNGAQTVMKDRLGQIIKDVDIKKQPRPGKDLVLSLDRRLQYLAYRELKSAVLANKAKSGSAVILDVDSGEVLAMVNQPALNPNNRDDYSSARSRNRAVTDLFEPGSTVKPFTIVAALESGQFKPNTVIDTEPGYYQVGRLTVRDVHDYGRLDLGGIIQKSSNVGASKLSLAIPPQLLLQVHQRVGFGVSTGSGFPGEVAGEMVAARYTHPIERATLSYGYGLSVTTLQLARAYSILAADGVRRPVSFLLQPTAVAGEAVLDKKITQQVRYMMESVVAEGGTAIKASIPGYLVAGKTGTVKKLGPEGYSDDKYVAVFAGMAPAQQPRLVMAIAIHEPSGKAYYGGQVAAPVFARVMAGALRLLDVPPDEIPKGKAQLAYLAERP